MPWWVPVVASIAGAAASSALNKPSGAQKSAQRAQAQAAQAQAAEIRRQTQARRELQSLIESLGLLSGEEKNKLIQLSPGKHPDFSGVRGTGDIDLLMQLAGLGSSADAVNSAALLAQQDIQSGRDTTMDTMDNLIQLLLQGWAQGGGGGGVPGWASGGGPGGTFSGDYGKI